jgi:hypothetical protein
MTDPVLAVLFAGLISALLAAGLSLGIAAHAERGRRALLRRCEIVEKAYALLFGEVATMRSELDAIKSGAQAQQIREVVDESLARARGYREERDEARAQAEFHRAERDEIQIRLSRFVRDFGNGGKVGT